MPASEQQAAWDEVIAAHYARPVDFTHQPLTRIYLACLGSSGNNKTKTNKTEISKTESSEPKGRLHWRMLFAQHHSLSDGWSLPVLLREVLVIADKLAAAVATHSTPDTALSASAASIARQHLPPASDYRDFVRWYFQQDQNRAHRFWRTALSQVTQACRLLNSPFFPAAEQTRLHTSIQARQSTPAQFKEWVSDWDTTLSNAVTGFCREHGVTLTALMQHTWGLLLQHYTQSRDVVYGTVVSGRDGAVEGIQHMVGLLVNTIPFAMIPDEQPTLLAALQATQQRLQQCNAHSYLPVSAASQQAEQVLLLPGSALFDTLLVVENYPTDEAEQAASQLQYLQLGEVSAQEHVDTGLSLAVVPGKAFWLRFTWRQPPATPQQESEMARAITTLAEHLKFTVTELIAQAPATCAMQQTQALVQGWQPPQAGESAGLKVSENDGAETDTGGTPENNAAEEAALAAALADLDDDELAALLGELND